MKKWEKMIHNCPYLLALIVTWLFFTIGGGILLWYRGYETGNWRQFVANPVFAVVVTEEIQGKITGMESLENNKETHVIKEKEQDNKKDSEKIEEKLNNNLIKFNQAEENKDKEDKTNKIDKTDKIEMILAGKEEIPETDGKNLGNVMITDDILLAKEFQTEESEERTEDSVTEELPEESYVTESAAEENTSENTDDEQDARKDAFVSGKTRFETYEPIETDSIYYSDAGKIAYTTDYEYSRVEDNYFEDAAFLGDSRTLGISDYAGLPADFYCESGMTVYKLLGDKGVVYQKSGQKVNLEKVLQQKFYGKIYIMLGMNELGYGNTEKYLEQYQSVVDKIRELQPEAVIFIMANLHVSAARNNMETEFNNVNINAKNAAVATLANGTDIFYLDSNYLFVDDKGFLKGDLTFDGVHLYANNYEVWKEFLKEHGVVKDDEGRTGSTIK